MSDEQLNLLLLGGLHVGDSSDRFELTKQKFDTVDTVFIESVTGDESRSTKVVNGFRAPLIVLAATIVLKGIELFANLTGKGDGQLKQHIVKEFDAEVTEIDGSFHPAINASPYFWPLSNYGFLFGIYALHTEFGDLTSSLIIFAYITIVTFLLYLAATLYGRDTQMALDVEQYAQAHSGNACAIVGEHHEKGLIDRLTNSSNVQIVPQDS